MIIKQPTIVEEFKQLLLTEKVRRIISPELMFALLSAAENGDHEPLSRVVALIREKSTALDSIEKNFEAVMTDIMKDFEVGVATVKAEERKARLEDLREKEIKEKTDLEEALKNSLINT